MEIDWIIISDGIKKFKSLLIDADMDLSIKLILEIIEKVKSYIK